MAIENYPFNEDWERVIPVFAYFELCWVSDLLLNELQSDETLYKYVMHRLRRSWKKQDTKELVEKFINDYYDEKNTWNE